VVNPIWLAAVRNQQSPSGGELIGLAISLALAVVVPLVGGLWIDSAAHSSPLGVVAGLLLGIVAATTTLYLRFKRYW
jgi:F0F1-type ATP synthase assembly protein I